jgi:hypothetical protein
MIDGFNPESQRLQEKRHVPVGGTNIQDAPLSRVIQQASKLAAQDRVERFEAG